MGKRTLVADQDSCEVRRNEVNIDNVDTHGNKSTDVCSYRTSTSNLCKEVNDASERDSIKKQRASRQVKIKSEAAIATKSKGNKKLGAESAMIKA